MNEFDPLDKESWYFGALKRQEAQDILESGLEEIGSFLVRDSSTCLGDFVLCVKEANIIRHYIIKKMDISEDGRVCFNIGNEIFTDVSSLLKYYTYNYLDNTFLSKPAAKLKFIGMYDFPGKDVEDLPFKKGEILTAVKKNEENWWTAKNSAGRMGSVPSPYIERYIEEAFQPIPSHRDTSPLPTNLPKQPLSPPSGRSPIPNGRAVTCDDPHPSDPNSTQRSRCPILPNGTSQGVKKNGYPKSHGEGGGSHGNGNNQQQQQQQQALLFNHFVLPTKNLPAYAVVRQARNPNAYDKTALKLKVGEVIRVTKMNINGQWEGDLNGKSGFFPFTHIQFIGDDKVQQFLSHKQPLDKAVSAPITS